MVQPCKVVAQPFGAQRTVTDAASCATRRVPSGFRRSVSVTHEMGHIKISCKVEKGRTCSIWAEAPRCKRRGR